MHFGVGFVKLKTSIKGEVKGYVEIIGVMNQKLSTILEISYLYSTMPQFLVLGMSAVLNGLGSHRSQTR